MHVDVDFTVETAEEEGDGCSRIGVWGEKHELRRDREREGGNIAVGGQGAFRWGFKILFSTMITCSREFVGSERDFFGSWGRVLGMLGL